MVKMVVVHSKNVEGDSRFNVNVFTGKSRFLEINGLKLKELEEVEGNVRGIFNQVRVVYKKGKK